MVRIRAAVKVRVYLLHLVRFYQAYCTLVVHYCYVTGGVSNELVFKFQDPQAYLQPRPRIKSIVTCPGTVTSTVTNTVVCCMKAVSILPPKCRRQWLELLCCQSEARQKRSKNKK